MPSHYDDHNAGGTPNVKYIGGKPDRVGSFLNQLFGNDPNYAGYKPIYPEGTPGYDISSGSVSPIGYEKQMYGNAPVQGTPVEGLPWLEPPPPGRNPTDREFSPTDEEITAEEFGDVGYDGPPPAIRGSGMETNEDRQRRIDASNNSMVGQLGNEELMDVAMDLEGEGPAAPPPPPPPMQMPVIPPNVPEIPKNVEPFVGTGLGGWKPSIPADNTPGSMIQNEGGGFDDWLNNLFADETAELKRRQAAGTAFVPRKYGVGPEGSSVANPVNQDASAPPPSGPPNVYNSPVGQGMVGPDVQAMSLSPPQGMGTGPDAQPYTVPPPPFVRTGGPGGQMGMAPKPQPIRTGPQFTAQGHRMGGNVPGNVGPSRYTYQPPFTAAAPPSQLNLPSAPQPRGGFGATVSDLLNSMFSGATRDLKQRREQGLSPQRIK